MISKLLFSILQAVEYAFGILILLVLFVVPTTLPTAKYVKVLENIVYDNCWVFLTKAVYFLLLLLLLLAF